MSFGEDDDAYQERHIEQYYHGGADEATFLTYGAEDEVGVLLGHEVVFGLRALQEALSREAARTDGNLGLVHVIAYALRVVELAEHDEDAVLLMLLQYIMEGVVDGENEDEHEGEDCQHLDDAFSLGYDVVHHGKDEQAAQDDVHDLLAPNQGKDKQEDGDDTCRHHPTGPREAFAVEHEDERHEDDGRTRVVLQQHQSHGDEHDDSSHDLVLALLQVHIEAVEVAGEGQGRGHFGEFGGLELDAGSEVDPGSGAFGGFAVDQHGEEAKEEEDIDP